MTTTYRNGKIARLPQPLREDLNHRLTNNTPGPEILDWLNTHPDVQKIMGQYFDGRPISQQNLSEWRHGGYKEWVKLQEKRQFTRELIEHSDALDSDFTPERITRAFATVAAADFVQDAQERRADCKNSKQRWECTCDIQNQLSRRRRDECRLGHLKLRQARWDYQVAADERAAEQAAADEERRQELAFFQLTPTLKEHCQQFGGTDEARDLSAYILELEHNLKQGSLGRRAPLPTFVTDSEGRVTRVPNTDPEGQVTVPIIGRVPNTEHPESSISSEPSPSSIQNPASSIGSDPIPLANSCSPEEFATRSLTPNLPQMRPTCSQPTPLSASQSITHKPEQTGTNSWMI